MVEYYYFELGFYVDELAFGSFFCSFFIPMPANGFSPGVFSRGGRPSVDRPAKRSFPCFHRHHSFLLASAAANMSRALLLSGAALAVAAGAYYVTSSGSKSRELGGADVDIDDLDNAADCITEDDVCAIFDQLFVQMQSVLAQLSQQIQQIQMSGQSIPEPQLRQLLRQEFDRALTSIQGKVFEENDVDEDCLQEATWEMLGEPEKYPKAKKAVERFQKLYENVTGEKVVGRRPGGGGGEDDKEAAKAIEAAVADISEEKLLRAAEIYFDALTGAMASIVKRLKDEGKDLRNPSVAQQLQMEFAGSANEAGEEALEKEGITLDTFRAAIEKHSSSPAVGRTLTMLQMKQQQELMALGVLSM